MARSPSAPLPEAGDTTAVGPSAPEPSDARISLWEESRYALLGGPLDDDTARLRNEALRPAGTVVCTCAPEARPRDTRAHEIGAAENRPAQVRSAEISPTKHRTRQVCATKIAAAEGNRREIGTTENGPSEIGGMEIHAGKIRSGKVHGRQVGVRQLNVRTSEQRRQSDCAP